MDLPRIGKRIVQLAKKTFEEQGIFPINQRCCLTITPQDLLIMHTAIKDGVTEVLMAETLRYERVDNLLAILDNLVKSFNLKNVTTDWVLSFDAYQLFLIESLPVPEDEFFDALKWRVRGLINYAVEEATIDYFKIPAKKSTPDSPLIAAISTKSTTLMPIIDVIKKSGLNLKSISIPEMMLKNISSYYEEDEKSTAIIYFQDKTAILNITLQKTLYFTRKIVLNTPIDPNINKYEQFALDILRYFDYFQSQWRNPSPSRILVHTATDKIDEIIKSLSDFLSLNVEPLTIDKLPVKSTHNKELENKFMLLLGSAIAIEDKDHATKN